MIAVVAGTRPEVIKLAPILAALKERKAPVTFIWTGQHYDDLLSDVFFDELDVQPDVQLGAGGLDEAGALSVMVPQLAQRLSSSWTTVVLGDTVSALAGALAARATHCRLAHVEAGLRCFDFEMFEERVRVAIDHMSHLLFAPHWKAHSQLLEEQLNPTQRLYVYGHTIVDSVAPYRKVIAKTIDVLVTIHRQENSGERLQKIHAQIESLAQNVKVVWPVHPRIADSVLRLACWKPPMPRGEFLQCLQSARVVLTDSGGVQEEAALLQTPCVTVRDATERQETVEAGVNVLVKPEGVLRAVTEILHYPTTLECREKAMAQSPWDVYGRPGSGARIAKELML